MYLQALDIMALLSYVTNQFETSTSPGPPPPPPPPPPRHICWAKMYHWYILPTEAKSITDLSIGVEHDSVMLPIFFLYSFAIWTDMNGAMSTAGWNQLVVTVIKI
jgi:hypothetical protein